MPMRVLTLCRQVQRWEKFSRAWRSRWVMLTSPRAAELCSAWTDEGVRPSTITNRLGRARGPSPHGRLRYSAFVDWKLSRLVAEMRAEVRRSYSKPIPLPQR